MSLFTPKWLTDEHETEKLTSRDKLEKALLDGKTIRVRQAAIRKMDPQDVYLNLSLMPKSLMTQDKCDVALTGIINLAHHDVPTLEKLMELDNTYIRRTAAKYIKSPELINRLALTDRDADVRLTACKMVKDDAVFAEILKKDTSLDMLFWAVDRVEDQKALEDFAANEKEQSLVAAAVSRFKNAESAADYYLKSDSDLVRRRALSVLTKLRNKKALLRVFGKMGDSKDKLETAKLLTELKDKEAAAWLNARTPHAPPNAVFIMQVKDWYSIYGEGWFQEGVVVKGSIVPDKEVKISTNTPSGDPATLTSTVLEIRKNNERRAIASAGETAALRIDHVLDNLHPGDFIYCEE